MRTRRVVGCMTGTSLDGIDAALVEVSGQGLAMDARFIRGHSAELGTLAHALRDLASQRPTPAGDIAHMTHELATAHAHAVRALLQGEPCDLVCAHGQTVYHAPPISWQLFQAAPLATALGVPVVSDLRQGDLALGGQGAPITPLADWVLLHRRLARARVLNLGGFANFSAWEGIESLRGGDIGACNQLLDGLARDRLGRPFDPEGRHALAGRPDDRAREELCELLGAQARGGRSLGTGDELAPWIDRARALRPEDALATACDAIARTIAGVLGDGTSPIVVAGGGVRNAALVRALGVHAGGVLVSDGLGLPAEFREAACFGVLGALAQDDEPLTRPGITGASAPALGGSWTFPARAARGGH